MRSTHVLPLLLLATVTLSGCDASRAARTAEPPVQESRTFALSIDDPDLDEPLPMDPGVTTGKLDNGLTYYIEPNQKPSDRVALRLVVKVGSVVEDDDQLGLAHLLEHMAFNGTTHFPANELVSYLESIGTQFGPHLNAYTAYDETVYMLQIPTDKPELVDKGFLVLSDWAQGMLLDDEEIEKERGVVLEERRSRRGAGMRLREESAPLIFGERYAARMPIGTEESLKTFDPDALRRFYRDWYRPDLMAVIVVGTIDTEAMREKIETYFSSLSNPEPSRPRPTYRIPDHAGTRYLVAMDPEFSTPSAIMAWTRDFHWQQTRRGYVESMVGDLFYVMLYERLAGVTRLPGAPFVGAVGFKALLNADKELHQVQVVLKPEDIPGGVEGLATEVRRIRLHGFTEDELTRAKERLNRQMEQHYEERNNAKSGNAAAEIVRNFTRDEPMPGVEMEWELHQTYLPRLTLADVNTYAALWLPPENRTVIVAIPEKEGEEKLTEKMVSEIVTRVDSEDVPPPQPAPTVKTLMEVLPAPGRIVSEDTVDEVGLTIWTLSNGVRVVVKPTDFKNEEILFHSWQWGGHSTVPDDLYVAAETAVELTLESGAGPVDRNGLERFLAGKQVQVQPYIKELSEGFTGQASPKDLETMFQLIFLYANNPRFDDKAFERVVERHRTMLLNRDAQPEMALMDEHRKQLAQNHLRRRPWTLETIEQMSLEDSTDVYFDLFSDYSGMTFVFVGNVDLPRLKELVTTYLGSLPGGGSEHRWKDIGVSFPDHPVATEVHVGIEPKSLVILTYFGDAEWSPEATFTMRSLADVVRIRTREVVREELSGTYGVGIWSNLTRWPKEVYQFSLRWGCDPTRVDELKQAVADVLEELKQDPIPEEYIEKVRETQRRTLETSLDQNTYWLRQLVRLYQNQLDPRLILQYGDWVEALTAEQVQAAARLYLVPERTVETVLYPAEPQEPDPAKTDKE